MRTTSKIVTSLAAVGLVAAAGSAFTATGLTRTAPATQFVGGTVEQTITGATLTGITYGFVDDTKTAASTVTLAFAPASAGVSAVAGKTVAAVVTAGGSPVSLVCPSTITTDSVVCEAADLAVGISNITAIAVTVS